MKASENPDCNLPSLSKSDNRLVTTSRGVPGRTRVLEAPTTVAAADAGTEKSAFAAGSKLLAVASGNSAVVISLIQIGSTLDLF